MKVTPMRPPKDPQAKAEAQSTQGEEEGAFWKELADAVPEDDAEEQSKAYEEAPASNLVQEAFNAFDAGRARGQKKSAKEEKLLEPGKWLPEAPARNWSIRAKMLQKTVRAEALKELDLDALRTLSEWELLMEPLEGGEMKKVIGAVEVGQRAKERFAALVAEGEIVLDESEVSDYVESGISVSETDQSDGVEKTRTEANDKFVERARSVIEAKEDSKNVERNQFYADYVKTFERNADVSTNWVAALTHEVRDLPQRVSLLGNLAILRGNKMKQADAQIEKAKSVADIVTKLRGDQVVKDLLRAALRAMNALNAPRAAAAAPPKQQASTGSPLPKAKAKSVAAPATAYGAAVASFIQLVEKTKWDKVVEELETASDAQDAHEMRDRAAEALKDVQTMQQTLADDIARAVFKWSRRERFIVVWKFSFHSGLCGWKRD
eukprot:g20036.t1